MSFVHGERPRYSSKRREGRWVCSNNTSLQSTSLCSLLLKVHTTNVRMCSNVSHEFKFQKRSFQFVFCLARQQGVHWQLVEGSSSLQAIEGWFLGKLTLSTEMNLVLYSCSLDQTDFLGWVATCAKRDQFPWHHDIPYLGRMCFLLRSSPLRIV